MVWYGVDKQKDMGYNPENLDMRFGDMWFGSHAHYDGPHKNAQYSTILHFDPL